MTITDSETLRPGEGHFTLQVVAAWSNSIVRTDYYWGYGLLFTKQGSDAPYTGVGLLANIDHETNTEASLSFSTGTGFQTWSEAKNLNDKKFRLCGVRRIADASHAPGAIEVRVNGVSSLPRLLPADDPHNLDAPNESAYIGGQKFTTYQALDGFIAEMLFVRGDLSDQDLEKLESYLNQKYRLW